jgi:hypothetical protein
MTPKEKAKELYNKFYNTSSHPHHVESRKNNAKQCALIAVDEILKSNEDWNLEQNIWCDTGFFGDCQMYWIAVKQEIEAL